MGRGRTAVFATGGDWRWQMLQPLEDMSHELFWRQMLRWLVSDTPTSCSWPRRQGLCFFDDGRSHLRAEVRDTTYLPTSDAQVEARILGPDGAAPIGGTASRPSRNKARTRPIGMLDARGPMLSS